MLLGIEGVTLGFGTTTISGSTFSERFGDVGIWAGRHTWTAYAPLLCAEKLSQRYDLASIQSSDHIQAVKRSHNPGKEWTQCWHSSGLTWTRVYWKVSVVKENFMERIELPSKPEASRTPNSLQWGRAALKGDRGSKQSLLKDGMISSQAWWGSRLSSALYPEWGPSH